MVDFATPIPQAPSIPADTSSPAPTISPMSVLSFDALWKQTTDARLAALEAELAALKKAGEKRDEEHKKLWTWVKALEQRFIRFEVPRTRPSGKKAKAGAEGAHIT